MPFDGETYDPNLDGARLAAQLHEVYRATIDGRWRTLEQIARIVAGKKSVPLALVPTQSVSARLRDFRKPKFQRKLGGFLIVKRLSRLRGIWPLRVPRSERSTSMSQVYQTENRTSYLKEPGVVLLAHPDVQLRFSDFLAGFDPELKFIYEPTEIGTGDVIEDDLETRDLGDIETLKKASPS